MSISYKKLDVTDFNLARELFIWFQEDDGDPEIHVPSDDYLKKLLIKEDFHVYVAMDGARLVGGLTAYELPMYKEEVNEIFLYEIGVEVEYRRMDIATNLIDLLKTLGAERSIPEMYVGTQMSNIAAQKLYQRTGGAFEKIAWYVYKIS